MDQQIEKIDSTSPIPDTKADGKMVLRTENLVKKYRQRTVVNHVSIDVTQGEIVGLLGPNGAGKTTTFYMTTGLITPNEGQIFLNDKNITKYPVYKRAQNGIGYLAQEASVFRKMTVENNIRSILEMTDMTKEQQRDKLESLISEFRLEKVRKNLGDRLSGGERRRTEIARCLAINPKFIMLDEPFAGVDPIAVEDIQEVVYKLKEKNIGILITDHNAQETLRITDRAYLLFEGKILFQGTSEELAANPVVREKYLGRNFIFHRKQFSPYHLCWRRIAIIPTMVSNKLAETIIIDDAEFKSVPILSALNADSGLLVAYHVEHTTTVLLNICTITGIQSDLLHHNR